jgi:zinc and cadmium transporter
MTIDPVLLWILGGTLAGGVLSVLGAALVSFAVLGAWVPRMVSYAVGVLLGSAFLHLLPEAFAHADDIERLFAVTLAGLFGFFLLEKALLWRHCHHSQAVHPPAGSRRRIGSLIVVGDGFHNLIDGVLIAAAFLADVRIGVAATVAIIVHEVPQEIGDFMVLLHAGYSRRKALLLNLASSLASVVGGVGGYFALSGMQAVVPYMLALAAASFIYIATADLIPHLHEHSDGRSALWQIVLIAVGVATIAGMTALAHAH